MNMMRERTDEEMNEVRYQIEIELFHLAKDEVDKLRQFFKDNGLYWREKGNCYYPQNVKLKECPPAFSSQRRVNE